MYGVGDGNTLGGFKSIGVQLIIEMAGKGKLISREMLLRGKFKAAVHALLK